MRVARIALFLCLLALPLVLAPSAGALDLCEEPHCQPPPGEQNTFYEWEFEAEEGCIPYFFKHINGALPAGLVVTEDGEVEGTPTEAGNFDFWVTLNDNGGPHNPACIYKGAESQAHFFLTIMPDLAVTTESVPAGVPGQPYTTQLQFSNPEAGWRVVWDIVGGSLPAGLTLSEAGVISGTPTVAGASTFVVRAREPFRRFGEKTLTLRVGAALSASSALGAGEVGLRYSGRIRTSGGIAPLAWTVATGTLPAGLALDQATGTVRGIPRRAGATALTFAVTDASGQRVSGPGEHSDPDAARDHDSQPAAGERRRDVSHTGPGRRRPCAEDVADRGRFAADRRTPRPGVGSAFGHAGAGRRLSHHGSGARPPRRPIHEGSAPDRLELTSRLGRHGLHS